MTETPLIKKKGKTNGYNTTKLKARRHRKVLEAERRQAIYDGLTLKQRLDLVESRGGSKRELARIQKLLEKQAAQPKPAKQSKPVKGYKPSDDTLATHASFA